MLKTNKFDLLGGSTNKNEPFIATINGVRRTLEQSLGLNSIRLITHTNQKKLLREEGQPYPYGFIRLTSLRVIKDRTNVKQIKRHGSSTNVEIAREITIDKGFMFPTALSMELVFSSDNLLDFLGLVQKLAIVNSVDGFTFGLNLPVVGDFFVGVRFEQDDFAIPQIDWELEENPSVFEATYPFMVETHLGIAKQVAKINIDGAITSSVGLMIDKEPANGPV